MKSFWYFMILFYFHILTIHVHDASKRLVYDLCRVAGNFSRKLIILRFIFFIVLFVQCCFVWNVESLSSDGGFSGYFFVVWWLKWLFEVVNTIVTYVFAHEWFIQKKASRTNLFIYEIHDKNIWYFNSNFNSVQRLRYWSCIDKNLANLNIMWSM